MPEYAANTFLEYLSDPAALLPQQWEESEAIAEIVRLCEQNGGATFSLYFGNQVGQPFYAVGLHPKVSKRLLLRDFAQLAVRLRGFLKAYRELLQHPRCCIGVWVENETAWIDVSVLVYNRERAQRFGEEGNQMEIYNLDTRELLSTGGDGLRTQALPAPEERLQWLEQNDSV